jgi:hypothetical protein
MLVSTWKAVAHHQHYVRILDSLDNDQSPTCLTRTSVPVGRVTVRPGCNGTARWESPLEYQSSRGAGPGVRSVTFMCGPLPTQVYTRSKVLPR